MNDLFGVVELGLALGFFSYIITGFISMGAVKALQLLNLIHR